MPAQTITVESGSGTTTGNVAYYAAGEPRLLKIREAFLSGKRGRDEVIKAVGKIVGRERYFGDWSELCGPIKGYTPKIRAWLAHMTENPELERIYGSSKIIAEFVMAPEVEDG